MSIAPDTQRLSVSTCDVKPRNIDWNPEDHAGNYVETSNQWWQSIDFDELDDVEYDFTLVAHDGSIVGVYLNGTVYSTWERYVDDHTAGFDADEEPIMSDDALLDEDQFTELMDIEPHMRGAEGPMMNYWYPLNENDDQYGRFDPIEAAGKLSHLPVCVVLVDDEYGLALTGGGMDLSWEICEAFIALGYLPPVHFADLPAYASSWRDSHQRVYDGMVRSLEWTAEQMTYRRERLEGLRERMLTRD